MATQTQTGNQSSPKHATGERLHCDQCGSEIEIVKPCGCNPPDQVLRCCGQDMKPTAG